MYASLKSTNYKQLLNKIVKNKATLPINNSKKQKKQEIDISLIKDFKAIFQMNLIANNLVTTKNIPIAEQVIGQNSRALKGKTKKKLFWS